MLKISISPDDKNADWLKTIINPETGKTYREEELAIHDTLAQQTTVKHQPGRHDQHSHGRLRKLGGTPTGKEPTNPLANPDSAENTEARNNWKNLSNEQKMALLDPDAINEQMARTLGKYRESASFLYQFEEGQKTDATAVGQMRGNAFSYLKTLEPALTPGTRKRMAEYIDMHTKALKEAIEDGSLPKGVKAADVNEMLLDNVDKMVYQESETRKRQLGDHGIRHVTGNIENAHKMLDQLEGTTGFDKLLAAQVMVDHDMGYTAGVVQKSFEATKYHELFSEKYARSEDEQYKKVFGDRTDELYNAVATHADFDLDWKGQPTLSAIRTADNLALFSRDKLPALFMDVPGATTTLYKLQLAKSVGQDKEMLPKVKEELGRLIDNTNLDERVKAELHSAAEEVMPLTGKFTLGMLAGEIEDFSYDGEKMGVNLVSKPEREVLNGLFDLGDRQFEKFLENYYQDGAAGDEGVDLVEKDSGQRVLKVKFKDQDTTVANRELVELNDVSVRPIIHKVVGALGENPDTELRDKVWKNLEKPLSARLTEKELEDFRKRYYGTDLLGFPLSAKEKAYLETEWKEKHLAGRHDQKSHGHGRVARGWKVTTEFRTIPSKEFESWANSWFKDLDGNERSGLAEYSGTGYVALNSALRRGERVWEDEGSQLYNLYWDVKNATRELPESVETYRGVKNAEFLSGLQEGQVFRDPGFVSTSSSFNAALFRFSDPIVLGDAESISKERNVIRVLVPRGTRAAAIPRATDENGNVAFEGEILLQPNKVAMYMGSELRYENVEGTKIPVRVHTIRYPEPPLPIEQSAARDAANGDSDAEEYIALRSERERVGTDDLSKYFRLADKYPGAELYRQLWVNESEAWEDWEAKQ